MVMSNVSKQFSTVLKWSLQTSLSVWSEFVISLTEHGDSVLLGTCVWVAFISVTNLEFAIVVQKFFSVSWVTLGYSWQDLSLVLFRLVIFSFSLMKLLGTSTLDYFDLLILNCVHSAIHWHIHFKPFDLVAKEF